MLVEYGEMGGYDDLIGGNAGVVGAGGVGCQLPDGGVLIEMELLRDGCGKFQRMELGLSGESNRPGDGEGERQGVCKLGRKIQLPEHLQLFLQLFDPVQGVDIGILFLEVTVDVPAERSILLQCPLVGLQVKAGGLQAVPSAKGGVDESVLGCDLGGGVLCDSAAEGFRLHQDVVHAPLRKGVGAQQAGHSSADNKNVGFAVLLQGAERGHRCGLSPERIHIITSALLCAEGGQFNRCVL